MFKQERIRGGRGRQCGREDSGESWEIKRGGMRGGRGRESSVNKPQSLLPFFPPFPLRDIRILAQ